jgi:hypothetical protein
MADISKCKGKGCPFKEKCYRFVAPANEFRQSYFREPFDKKTNKCEYLWQTT